MKFDSRILHLCYTTGYMARGSLGVILLVLSIIVPIRTLVLIRGGMGQCRCACGTHCTCGCCMHGHGMCPMRRDSGKMEHGSSRASKGTECQCGVTCNCRSSRPGTTFIPTHLNFFFGRPAFRLWSKLPLSPYRSRVNSAWLACRDLSVPDPPPKTFSI